MLKITRLCQIADGYQGNISRPAYCLLPLQIQQFAQLGIVSQLAVRIQRQVIGKQVYVVREQGLHSPLLHTNYSLVFPPPEITVMHEHGVGTLCNRRVYLNPPMEVCIQRDPSGLYAAADSGDSGDIPGLSFPYTPPELAHLELDTAALEIDDCLDQVLALMKEQGII